MFSGQSLQCTRNQVFDVFVLQTVEQLLGDVFSVCKFQKGTVTHSFRKEGFSFASFDGGKGMPKPCLGLSFPYFCSSYTRSSTGDALDKHRNVKTTCGGCNQDEGTEKHRLCQCPSWSEV